MLLFETTVRRGGPSILSASSCSGGHEQKNDVLKVLGPRRGAKKKEGLMLEIAKEPSGPSKKAKGERHLKLGTRNSQAAAENGEREKVDRASERKRESEHSRQSSCCDLSWSAGRRTDRCDCLDFL